MDKNDTCTYEWRSELFTGHIYCDTERLIEFLGYLRRVFEESSKSLQIHTCCQVIAD